MSDVHTNETCAEQCVSAAPDRNSPPLPEYAALYARIEAILSYSDLGIPVIPLALRSKKPIRSRWQRSATDDVRKLFEVFTEFPDANIGLLMGGEIRSDEFAFALDIDPRHAGDDSLVRLLRQLDISHLPKTATAITGSGGWHVLMTAPFPVKSVPNGFGPSYPGLDLKGTGGYIVAAPSVHPETGREYRWTIHPADGVTQAPEQLLKLIRSQQDGQRGAHAATTKRNPPSPQNSSEREPDGSTRSVQEPESNAEFSDAHDNPGVVSPNESSLPPPLDDRTGDVKSLTADVIDRFPISVVGTRWNQMRAAIGSLIGRGYTDDLVKTVMRAWHDHYRARGLVRTPQVDADVETERCIRATRRNREFVRAVGSGDHRSRCRQIELGDLLIPHIRSGEFRWSGPKAAEVMKQAGMDQPERELLEDLEFRRQENIERPTPTNQHSKRVTLIRKRRSDSEFVSERDEAFVVALVVQVLHKMGTGEFARDGVVRMTDQQLKEIVVDRYPHLRWSSNQQFERLKRKYISRPDKPATEIELLREKRKGERPSPWTAGTPSEHEPTGIKKLLSLVPGAGLDSDAEVSAA